MTREQAARLDVLNTHELLQAMRASLTETPTLSPTDAIVVLGKEDTETEVGTVKVDENSLRITAAIAAAREHERKTGILPPLILNGTDTEISHLRSHLPKDYKGQVVELNC